MAGLVAIVWGLCFVMIAASLPLRAPLMLAGLRALIGGGVLALWLVARRRRNPGDGRGQTDTPRAQRSAGPLPPAATLLALAIMNGVLGFGSMYLAAGKTEATVSSVVTGSQPIVLVAAGWLLFDDHVSARVVVGIAMAMVGVSLVATAGSGPTSAEGVVLALVATAAPASGTIIMRRLGSTIDVARTTSVQFILGGAMLLVLSLFLEPWRAVAWTPAVVASLLTLGLIGTGLAYVVWFLLVARLSFVQLGVALYLVPVVGIVAAVLLGNRPAPIEWAGIAALAAGIAVVSIGDSRAPAARPSVRRRAQIRRVAGAMRRHPLVAVIIGAKLP